MKNEQQQRVVELIELILTPPDDLSSEDLSSIEDEFAAIVPHPASTALLHYPEDWGLSSTATPQQIAKQAFEWSPQCLAMRIVKKLASLRSKDYANYVMEVEGRYRVPIVGLSSYNVGDIVAVAFSGVMLPNGRIVRHGFDQGSYSVGEILGHTSKSVGEAVPPASMS